MRATDTHMSDKMQKHLHLSLTCLNTTDKRAWMHPIKKSLETTIIIVIKIRRNRKNINSFKKSDIQNNLDFSIRPGAAKGQLAKAALICCQSVLAAHDLLSCGCPMSWPESLAVRSLNDVDECWDVHKNIDIVQIRTYVYIYEIYIHIMCIYIYIN